MLYRRYIFNKTLIGFLALVAIFVALIWFSRAMSFVKYVTENGVEISKFLSLFLLILPWLLLLIIPISLFVAILLIYSRMISHNEVTILKNAGLTKFKICKPIFSLSILLSLICFAISFYIMPYANKQLRLLRIDFNNNYANLSFKPQTFETLKNLTIYAKKRDEANKLFGIFLHDERSRDYSITITAKSGNIVVDENSALLYMQDGTVQKFNREDYKSEVLQFDSYVFNLNEGKEEDSKLRWKPKERYLHELLEPDEDSSLEEVAKYRAELHQRLTYPLLSLIFAIIAASCVLRGSFNRHGNYFNILLATLMATGFLTAVIACYDLIESSEKFIPILYLIFPAIFLICLRILNGNYRKKSPKS